jgi:two-component system, OmpR family, phosphate regulon sensor histidine kinase PhoR
MFWRLYIAFVALAVAPLLVLGFFLYTQAGSHDLFADLWLTVLPTVLLILAMAALVALLLARRFTRPLHELEAGAKRLANGDFSSQIRVAASREFVTLARSFNTMTDRLAYSFTKSEQDREQLRTILSGMVEGVVAIDNQQCVLFANERAGELLEFDPSQVVGRLLWEASRQRSLREVVEKAIMGGGPQRQELEWSGPVDKYLTVYVSRLPGAKSHGAVLVIHDTTELRRLERLRQDFVANVSHELKTPLANIKSSVETLIDGAVEDPTVRSLFLSQIAEQSDRQQLLIEDLLSLARIESTENGLQAESVNLDDAVHACLDRHRTRAEAKDLMLDGVALAETQPDLAAWVDEEGLAQLLDNLVDNAIKYTPGGGRITVRWRAFDASIWLEVEDTGIGIPEAQLPRVFERFYRVDRARSRELGGTGLGLAIVKHLAQGMRGNVTVSSELGVGTKFSVCLPMATHQQ